MTNSERIHSTMSWRSVDWVYPLKCLHQLEEMIRWILAIWLQ